MVEQIKPDTVATSLESPPGTGVFDQDTAHGLGCCDEEVSPVVELLIAHQPEISFMQQGGWL